MGRLYLAERPCDSASEIPTRAPYITAGLRIPAARTATMFPLLLLVALLAPLVAASPIARSNKSGFLCGIPFFSYGCEQTRADPLTIVTSLGTAVGSLTSDGAYRFPVKYANADRWKTSSVVDNWELPNGADDATATPKACPQPNMDDSEYSEDCLSMILYVPPNLSVWGGVPTLMWVHGGSFYVGSASNDGLDGSKLAIATGSIVAVVQYRLGALGFMAPDDSTNLAVQDVMNAMKFVQGVVSSFGGNSKITLSGQSSGANMIRALLATPSADDLFESAILQSDTIDYGFLTPSTQSTLQSHFNGLINCADGSESCTSALSLSTILDASSSLFADAYSLDPSATQFAPMRPVRDGALITSALDLTSSPFPAVSKPILLTTVANEAAPTIYGNMPALGAEYFFNIAAASYGDDRTETLENSTYYSTDGVSDIRPVLETLGTDSIWRCPAWSLARLWAGAGASAYVGVYTHGATYPSNSGVSQCASGGLVCHEDDIYIVFGTTPNPSSAQSALTREVQARYKAFMSGGKPNAGGYAKWGKAGTGDVKPLNLGGTSAIEVGACDPGFWGKEVEYDYQVYGA
uniref:Carboxylesterase type B domain-containing protein n=1 Tax=Schizophyllum commune (strain H4-8 / FGSC 9210) TaxID=578458 RepID=D8PV19_SCHCM